MGMINQLFGYLFGGQSNVLRDTVEVFRENAEAGSQRNAEIQMQAMTQFGTEFSTPRTGKFDQFMDALNRLPRPAMALGTLGLFVSAMLDPLWFAQRMQGIALVPEPLWWLLGVIVSFYFGARHQVKSQQFQQQIFQSMSQVPQVVQNINALKTMRAQNVGVADTGHDTQLTLETLKPSGNEALDLWRAKMREA